MDADAMDKLTGRYDVNPPGRPLIRDAMDQITGINDLKLFSDNTLHVEMNQTSTNNDNLCVETGSTLPDKNTPPPKCVWKPSNSRTVK